METILEINIIEDLELKTEHGYHDHFEGYEIKTNKQVIQILITNMQSCCESFGYFSSEDNPNEFVGSGLIEITLTDTALNTKTCEKHVEYGLDEGDIMFITLNTTKGPLQFAVYNAHNGYYGHTAKIISNKINEERTL